ncbi:MAG: hypothetical protein COW30_11595 [Rhodospirillales bacterium CG15_BIG_FIL_POST_REV_8_21_14_020_66_15]|nr:MAG: hypothetical protein COW30_11595 [Rhodospirillales bacterium CG15_BIG_FIL_POST_REV_8_21_14_020_66_15]
MSARNFLILLVTAVLGVVAATAAVLTRPGDSDYANLGEPVFPGLIDTVNDVDKVRIESREGGVLTFQRRAKATDAKESGAKEAGGWGIVERDMYPVKATLVSALALRVAQLTYLAPKTANPDLFPRLDLGDPNAAGSKAVSLRLIAKDGRTMAELVIGTARSALEGSAEGGTYLRLPGKDQAWLAKGSVDVGKRMSEWIETDIFDIGTKRIRRVEISHADGEKLALFKDQETDPDFILEDVSDGMKVKSRFSVNGIAASIDDYKIMDVARREKHPIDPANATRVVYRTFDGLTVTALIQLPDGDRKGSDAEYWVALDVAGGEGAAEADGLRARTGPWVFRISDYRYDAIAKRMKDLVEDAGAS